MNNNKSLHLSKQNAPKGKQVILLNTALVFATEWQKAPWQWAAYNVTTAARQRRVSGAN